MRIVVIIIIGAIAGLVIARSSACHDRSAIERRNPPPPSAKQGQPAPLRVQAPMAAVLQRDLQPSDRRYNPLLLMEQSSEELTPKEVFEREPRDPTFAPIFERRVHTTLDNALRELGFDDKDVRIETECKTLSCTTRIEIAKAGGQRLYDAINGVMFGDVQEPGIDNSDPDHTYVTLTNLYRPESRDDKQYDDFINGATRPSLEAAKQRMAQARDEAPR